MTTRSISGLTLRAISPAYYQWAVDPQLEFKFNGLAWRIVVRQHLNMFRFPSLASACEFCVEAIRTGAIA